MSHELGPVYMWNCAVCGIGPTVALGSVSKLGNMLGSLDYNLKLLYLHKPLTNYAILNVEIQNYFELSCFLFPEFSKESFASIIIYFFNKIRIIFYKTYSVLCII